MSQAFACTPTGVSACIPVLAAPEQVTSPSPRILLSPSLQLGCQRLIYPLRTSKKIQTRSLTVSQRALANGHTFLLLLLCLCVKSSSSAWDHGAAGDQDCSLKPTPAWWERFSPGTEHLQGGRSLSRPPTQPLAPSGNDSTSKTQVTAFLSNGCKRAALLILGAGSIGGSCPEGSSHLATPRGSACAHRLSWRIFLSSVVSFQVNVGNEVETQEA